MICFFVFFGLFLFTYYKDAIKANWSAEDSERYAKYRKNHGLDLIDQLKGKDPEEQVDNYYSNILLTIKCFATY